MKLNQLTTILAMYAAATALLWVATRFLSHKDQKISAFRCFGVAFVLTFLGNALQHFLTPLIGDWVLLLSLVLCVLLVMGLFSLALWRSILVTIIYYAGIFALYFLLKNASQ